MRRRNLALPLAALLLLGGIAGAIAFLGPPRVDLTPAPDQADHVTLYHNGLAFVRLARAFESQGGESLLALSLPATARFDSVAIEGEGVVVKQLRSTLAARASLEPGERVVVHAGETRAYEGTFVGQEGESLLLATETGVTVVRLDQVTAIEVTGRQAGEARPGTMEVTALVEAPAGTRRVEVSYLAEGPGWTPSYELDAGTGDVVFYATLTGLDDWENVTLDLVSGAPHVVLQPRPARESGLRLADGREAAFAADVDDAFAPSQPLGDLHRYRYAEPIDLQRGQTVRLAVERGTLDVVRHAHVAQAQTGWGGHAGAAQPVTVREVLEVRNALGEPLPPGVVRAYRDGTWIGEDALPATPRGERANLTLAFSQDVTARLVLEQAEASGNVDTYTYALRVENHKDQPVDLRAVLQWPGHRTTLLSAEPEPDERMGASASWDRALQPGEEATFRIRYQTMRH